MQTSPTRSHIQVAEKKRNVEMSIRYNNNIQLWITKEMILKAINVLPFNYCLNNAIHFQIKNVVEFLYDLARWSSVVPQIRWTQFGPVTPKAKTERLAINNEKINYFDD